MNNTCFKKYGWFYLPVDVPGLLITCAAILLLVPVYLAIIGSGHSVSDELYDMFYLQRLLLFGGGG